MWNGKYATATFKVLNAYAGWSNVNYVLNEVRNPVRTLKIAGPLGLGICAVLYMLANISYFSYVIPLLRSPLELLLNIVSSSAATIAEIEGTGVTVASLFFKNVFGEQAQKALTVFVALRYVFDIAVWHANNPASFQCTRVS